MKKKVLLTLLAIVCICALCFGIVSCSPQNGNDNDTNVEEPDVPLNPDTECQHTNLSHETETSSTCNVHGHTEYWFCGDCNKYFANEACTVETTLAAVTKAYGDHKYGEWIDEEPADCTDNGTLGHYHCSVCQKNFDAEKEELTSLVIPAAHDYGTWVPAVQAEDCQHRDRVGYYYCEKCDTYFDEDYEVIPPVLLYGAYGPHKLEHDPAVTEEEADCGEYYYDESWYCTVDGCEAVFADAQGREPLDFVETTLKEHNYVYTYNYTTCEYDGVCSHNSAHTDTIAAGTEAYPYLANDEASLNAAVGKGGYVKLTADITADVVIAQGKEVNLNLNGYRLSNSASHTIVNNGTLTLIGGGTVYNGTHKMAALSNTGVATVNGVTLERIYVAKTDTTALNSHYTVDNTNGGAMTLINATVISENNMVTSLVRNIGATMTIESGEYTTANIIIKNDDEGVLTVNGGKFVGIQSIQNWGTATINGGEVTYVKTAIWSSEYKSTTYINDNNFGGELVLEYNENYVGKYLTDDSAPVLKVKNGISHTEPQIRIATSTHGSTENEGYSVVTAEESGYTVYTLALPTFVKDAAAFKAALANGGNIKLMADMPIDELITISNNTAINLNGHTLSVTSGAGRPLGVGENVTLTINDGNIVIPETNIYTYGIISLGENAKAHLSNVNMTGNTDAGGLIRAAIVSSCEVTLYNCTATTNYLVVNLYSIESGKLTVNGGEYNLITEDSTVTTGEKSDFYAGFKIIGRYITDEMIESSVYDVVGEFTDVTINSGSRLGCEIGAAKAIFNNCEIASPSNNSVAGYLSSAIAVSNSGNIIINGGSYTGTYAVYTYSSAGIIEINGGTFNGNFKCDVAKEYCYSDAKIIINDTDMEFVWDTDKYNYTASDSNATFDCYFINHRTMEVSTADEFKAAIAQHASINLLADITLDATANLYSDVTIDLNGHTITYSGTTANTAAIKVNAGRVTITNGSVISTDNMGFIVAPTAECVLTDCDVTAKTYAIYANGKVDITGGTYTANTMGLAIFNGGHVEATDITVVSANYGAQVGNGTEAKKGTLILHGGSVSGNALCGIITYGYSTVEATGTTISCAKNIGFMGNGTCVGDNVTLTNCTVTGGKVGLYFPQKESNLTVSGGTYTGSMSGVEVRGGTAEIDGATLTATSETFATAANGDGATVTGAALAVSQHTTDGTISVTVTNCTLIGIYALYEKDVQNETARDQIAITLGEGNTLNGYVYSENCENIVDTADDSGNALTETTPEENEVA